MALWSMLVSSRGMTSIRATYRNVPALIIQGSNVCVCVCVCDLCAGLTFDWKPDQTYATDKLSIDNIVARYAEK